MIMSGKFMLARYEDELRQIMTSGNASYKRLCLEFLRKMNTNQLIDEKDFLASMNELLTLNNKLETRN